MAAVAARSRRAPAQSDRRAVPGHLAIDDKRPYFEASPLSYVSAKNNGTAFLICWGDADDVVDTTIRNP
jgi:hypothetical protein